jgi:hypothetical protein
MNMSNPGAATSHFQDLDVSSAGTLTLNTFVEVSGQLISQPVSTPPTLKGSGNSLSVKSVGVQGLTVDNAPIIIDEQGVGVAEQFDNVTFQNFPTTGTTMLSFTGPGGAASPRNMTFDTVNFQSLPVGAGNVYVKLVSSSFGLNLTMLNSNQSPQQGGNGPANSNPPNQTTVSGATILWP